jgi:precorrin-4 methylase
MSSIVKNESLEVAFQALRLAAEMIKNLEGVADVSVDNDNDSGEVVFVLHTGESFILTLKRDDE